MRSQGTRREQSVAARLLDRLESSGSDELRREVRRLRGAEADGSGALADAAAARVAARTPMERAVSEQSLQLELAATSVRLSVVRAVRTRPSSARRPAPPLPSRQRPHLLSPVPVSVPQRLRHTQEELAAAAQRGARLQNGGQELLTHGERLLRTQEAAEARAVKAKAMLVAKAGEMAQLEAALHVVSSDGFAMHAELVALRQLCVRLGAHPDRVRRTRRQQLSTSIASSRGRALYTGSNNDGIDGASVLRSPGATLRAAHAASVAAQEAARCAHTSLGTAATDEAAAAERRRAVMRGAVHR